MAKEALIVKTTNLPKSRISLELEIPSETCKTCVNETITLWIVESLFNGAKTNVNKMVVQFGFAITPSWFSASVPLTSGTIRGTF